MKFRTLICFALIAVLTLIVSDAEAQCAMCKEVVGSGAKNGSNVAKGLNSGILYLLTIPFLAIGTFSFAFWRRWKASQK